MTKRLWLLLILMLQALPALAEDLPAADTPTDSAPEDSAPAPSGHKDFLVLKMMIVNPSDKHDQVYPMKAYLPEEVQEEHVLDIGDLELGFDSEKSMHYVHKDIELKPGESVVKAIKIRDVWFIPDPEMEKVADEARDLYDKLSNTSYGKQGRLLLTNVETLLLQIQQSQHDETLTPDEHIALFKSNKKKFEDIQMDVMAMRRFLVTSGETDGGSILPIFGGKGDKASAANLGSEVLPNTSNQSGMLPAWVMWRIVFAIIGFTGMMSLLFFGFWQHQLRMAEGKRKHLLEPGEQKTGKHIRLGDFLGPEAETATPAAQKKKNAA